jgi:hypothetical protein
VYSIETPRVFALRHDTTTLGVLRRCATALICTAGVALLFWMIGSLLGIGSGGYGNADCTGKHHVRQRSDSLPKVPCALSSDAATPTSDVGQVTDLPTAVSTPAPDVGQVPDLPTVASVPASDVGQVPDLPMAVSVPATTSVFAPAAGSDPKLATSEGRLDYLKKMFRWPVVWVDGLIVVVFGAGALLLTLVPRALTWVRWGGTRVAWAPDVMPVLAPRTRVWFAWFWLAAAAAGESVRLTSLSEKLIDDGFVLAIASGVVFSWLLLTVVIGFLNGLIVVFGEIRTSIR